jgi:uncharacterized protein YndB with AHSA1/START domain
MSEKNFITVEVWIQSSIENIWKHLLSPDSVKKWNAASPDWHTPRASVDLRVGGKFIYRMEARDGSMGFDLVGIFTSVEPLRSYNYTLEDGRTVAVSIMNTPAGVHVREVFQAENQNAPELQRAGWQSILDNFKRFVESEA